MNYKGQEILRDEISSRHRKIKSYLSRSFMLRDLKEQEFIFNTIANKQVILKELNNQENRSNSSVFSQSLKMKSIIASKRKSESIDDQYNQIGHVTNKNVFLRKSRFPNRTNDDPFGTVPEVKGKEDNSNYERICKTEPTKSGNVSNDTFRFEEFTHKRRRYINNGNIFQREHRHESSTSEDTFGSLDQIFRYGKITQVKQLNESKHTGYSCKDTFSQVEYYEDQQNLDEGQTINVEQRRLHSATSINNSTVSIELNHIDNQLFEKGNNLNINEPDSVSQITIARQHNLKFDDPLNKQSIHRDCTHENSNLSIPECTLCWKQNKVKLPNYIEEQQIRCCPLIRGFLTNQESIVQNRGKKHKNFNEEFISHEFEQKMSILESEGNSSKKVVSESPTLEREITNEIENEDSLRAALEFTQLKSREATSSINAAERDLYISGKYRGEAEYVSSELSKKLLDRFNVLDHQQDEGGTILSKHLSKPIYEKEPDKKEILLTKSGKIETALELSNGSIPNSNRRGCRKATFIQLENADHNEYKAKKPEIAMKLKVRSSKFVKRIFYSFKDTKWD